MRTIQKHVKNTKHIRLLVFSYFLILVFPFLYVFLKRSKNITNNITNHQIILKISLFYTEKLISILGNIAVKVFLILKIIYLR